MFKQKKYFIPKKAGEVYHFGQLINASYAIECAKIIENYFGFILIVTSNTQDAIKLFNEITTFTSHSVYYFPDWETIPYSNTSPNPKIISNRIYILSILQKIRHGILIISIQSLMQRLCPNNFLSYNIILIKIGDKLSNIDFKNKLDTMGYRYVDNVLEPGEYNVKKNIIFDLFPVGKDKIYRIDLLNDQINSISKINLEKQEVIEEVSKINLLPKHEFPSNKNSLKLFCYRWEKIFDKSCKQDYVYKNISMGILPFGIEYWHPIFFDQPLSNLFNYLPSETVIINQSNLEQNAIIFWENLNKYYKNQPYYNKKYLLKPIDLWMTPDYLINQLKNWPQIKTTHEKLPNNSKNINLGYEPLPSLTSKGVNKFSLEYLDKFIKKFTGYIIFCVKDEISQRKFKKLFNVIKINPIIIKNLDELSNQKFFLIINNINHGFIDSLNNKAIICENDIIPENFNYHYKNKIEWNATYLSKLVSNLEEISFGQPIVHIEHGIGRYMGLTIIETKGIKAEYLILSYADDAKLYVPVSSLHLISYYMGYSKNHTPLHKLGSDIWVRSRQKAIEKIRDIAAELLDIYSKRDSNVGFSFKYDKHRYHLFCNKFPFKITLDQKKAIDSILKDMCQPITMDRLICGDVGFGKTEIAMRAAFIAVENNKQVAILVPTTILAQQHYENFKNRFNHWCVHIDVLSNFRTFKEQKYLLEQTKEGTINILIGTHKLLNKNIKWKDLGLLIIDEEHRFGVRQKECIKAISNNIDIITLTATPIPRTLHMAMTGMRDVSIIATAPDNRRPIKTFITEFNCSTIREAILREILRGGQVYYLHNQVNDIEKTANFISKLVPEARVTIGHGQMHDIDLEKVMHNFHCQRFNVLVCTTIIENGIDIPNANTIIIEQANNFGLAQLHQLRGRVGRSHHQAYAWLLISKNKSCITNEAIKRFEVISSLEELGSGFQLATNDLEIRGSGELLGEKQSGQIETLGFSLYLELLEKSIHELKDQQNCSPKNWLYSEIEIELQIPSLIPENFITDVNKRLSLYKRIASATNESDIQEVKIELINNFGSLPESTHNLFNIALLRLQARQLGIRKIKISDKGGYFDFYQKNNINILKLVNLIQKEPNKWKLEGKTKLRFYYNEIKEKKSRIYWIQNFINNLTN
ncbi:transcription-repair coupling factor [Candidatus Pantoea edessiphila]|uniref:Transcription-repair-coupling factor n=1 Tax=Candidatus Pantoea edessiphila TaxID=2044610 RepID=A0A2P5T2K2_9GAMM|nr:transcription-repair coupling factor [Candidatus Pantoea edessiphila]PPI88780.1 transcription-repair coupling factor [Candidatus Pantoea edessiphila]